MKDLSDELLKLSSLLRQARVKSVDSAPDPDTGMRGKVNKERSRARQNKRRTGDSSGEQKRERADLSGLSTREAEPQTSDERPD